MGDIEGGLVDEGLVVLQCFEILSGILDDVIGMIAQYFPCEIFENGGEVLGNWVFLDIPARHQLQYYYQRPRIGAGLSFGKSGECWLKDLVVVGEIQKIG